MERSGRFVWSTLVLGLVMLIAGVGGLPMASSPAAAASAANGTVEPAKARLKVIKAEPVFTQPSNKSKKIATLTPGKYVQVTGSTHYYLQVQLKNGQTGYISPSAVKLVTAAKKSFRVTQNSPVFDVPNQWGKKVGAVRMGRYVNVTGIALNYVRVQLRDGTRGFIPITAVQ
jgi:hypothetical protein